MGSHVSDTRRSRGVVSEADGTQGDRNRLRPEDRPGHQWYRFVLSFPPHLVRDYIERLGVDRSHTVLDPFCGTGTTLVECKKLGISSVGLESNPMGSFASSVKIDWSADPAALSEYSRRVAASARRTLEREGIQEAAGLPLFAVNGSQRPVLQGLPPDRSKLLLKDSISPLPLHKTLTLLDAVDRHDRPQLRSYARLALANALVQRIGNLKFGPEVGVGRIKDDAPAIDAWLACLRTIAGDLRLLKGRMDAPSRVVEADARTVHRALEPESVDAVITSPPYPNEKDYTRTTRLESVILGLVRDRQGLRSMKRNLIRSNTRGVYQSDTDDREVADHAEIRNIAEAIEKRRIELGKTSGFERLYPRVTRLYVGGMAKHLASLRAVLRPGARLAYVVGEQASYLRVRIPTGRILADLARSLDYRVTGIDLFRTRPSTVTGEQLREEVVLLEWPGR